MDIWQEVRKGLFIADAEVESARFLERVVDMARRNGASLTVAHCLEEPSRWSSAQAKEVHALLRREWERELEKLSAAHCGHGLTVDSLLLTGDPVKEIATLVERDGYDFVAKVASDQAERGRLSGTEIDLIRRCPCNVWIDRPPRAGDRYQTVLLAVDCMDPDHERLNQEMTTGAARFCEAEDATLHLLPMWDLPGETMLRGRSFTGREKIDAMVEHERRLHVASECRAELETHCANVEVGRRRGAVPESSRERPQSRVRPSADRRQREMTDAERCSRACLGLPRRR
jgi:universal stress protein E